MPLFDRPEPPDLFRDHRQRHRKLMVIGGQVFGEFAQKLFIVSDEAPFSLPLGRVAESIEGRPAQEFEFRQRREDLLYRRAE